MSEENNGQDQAPRQRGASQTQEIACTQCKTLFTVIVPPGECINGLFSSAFIISHSELQCCPSCGMPYQIKIKAVQSVAVEWHPCPGAAKGSARLIEAPPPGFDPKKKIMQ